MRNQENQTAPTYKREDESHDSGFNALDYPHEGYVSQSNSEKGITAPNKMSRLGKLGMRKHVSKEESQEAPATFKKDPRGWDKLIVDLDDDFEAPYNVG
jgi:hypothetical protein